MIEIWVDGGTRKNGTANALGAWAYYGYYDFQSVQVIIQAKQAVENTTNQRMELTAAIKAIEKSRLNNPDMPIVIYTDSAYLYNCWKDKWYYNWLNSGWLNSKNEPVANKDLWEQLIPHFKHGFLTIKKVKGHSGNKGNEIADRLVNQAMDEYEILKGEGVIE